MRFCGIDMERREMVRNKLIYIRSVPVGKTYYVDGGRCIYGGHFPGIGPKPYCLWMDDEYRTSFLSTGASVHQVREPNS